MLTSDWFDSDFQVKLENDVNILRLTPFYGTRNGRAIASPRCRNLRLRLPVVFKSDKLLSKATGPIRNWENPFSRLADTVFYVSKEACGKSAQYPCS